MPERSHGTSCCLAAPPAVTPRAGNPGVITFLQADNWRNGNWEGTYGAWGRSLLGLGGYAEVWPANVAHADGSGTLFNPWAAPAPPSDPRKLQIPGTNQTGLSGYAVAGSGSSFAIVINCQDSMAHSFAIYSADIDGVDRVQSISAYDVSGTPVLLDGPRTVPSFLSSGVYMVYNISGYCQFNVTFSGTPTGQNAIYNACFLDLRRSLVQKTHSTSSNVQPAISNWQLEEVGTGMPAADALGHYIAYDQLGNTTDTKVAPIAAPGPGGGAHARNFPGTPGTVLATFQAPLHSLVNFSVMAWVRAAGRTANQPIVTHQTVGTTGWGLMTDADGFAAVTTPGGGTDGMLSSEYPLPLGVWTHVACVFGSSTGGGARILYVNGRMSSARWNAVPNDSPYVQTLLGQDYSPSGAGTSNLSGDLDDVRIYGIPLTVNQVQSCVAGNPPFFVAVPVKTHSTGSLLQDPRLVSYWKLDETAAGATAADSGSAAANAVDTNANIPGSTTAPIAAPTNFSNPRGRKFPAGTCSLNAGTPAAHRLADNFSVGFWCRPASIATGMCAIGRFDVTTNAMAGWNFVVNAAGGYAGKMTFRVASTGTTATDIYADAQVVLNAWQHVVGVQRNGIRSLYINGVKQAMASNVPWVAPATTIPTLVGQYNLTYATGWNGDLDDVRYYSVPLTDDQIYSLGGGNEPYKVAVTTVAHGGDAYLVRAPATARAHTADTAALVAAPRAHGGDAYLYPTATVTRAHAGDARTLLGTPRTHGTSSQLADAGRLVSWWKLDEIAGGLPAIDSGVAGAPGYDTSGNTTSATPAPTTFFNPVSRHFPAATFPPWTCLNAGAFAAHRLADNYSVSFWVRPLTFTYSTNFVSRMDITSGALAGWGFAFFAGTNKFAFRVVSGANAFDLISDVTAAIGGWYNLVGVQRSGVRSLYINGVKQSATSNAAYTQPGTTIPMYLGPFSGNGNAFDLDDVRYYNGVLGDDQAQSLGAGNDPFTATATVQAHATSAYVYKTTAIKPHTTGSVTATAVTRTVAHTGDSLLRAAVARPHASNSLIRATATRAHTGDSRAVGSITRAHSGDSLLRATATKVHTTSSLLLATVARTHTGNSLARATATRAHSCDGLARATATRAHATDAFLPGAVTITVKADALIALGIMASRSRSQRVGTRTLAFGDSP